MLTSTGTTNVTLPQSGTLATLTGAETFAGKTISGLNNTISNISLNSCVTGVLPVANGGTGVCAIPKFRAFANTDQSIAGSTWVKLAINQEVFDTNGNYDSSVNYRFTPTVPGIYWVSLAVLWISIPPNVSAVGAIYKNGYEDTRFQLCGAASATLLQEHVVTALISLNGSTDYLEFFVYQTGGSPLTVAHGPGGTLACAALLP